MNSCSDEIETAIASAAIAHSLDANLIRAICNTESAFITWRTRFEPEGYARGSYFVSYRDWASKLGLSEPTEGTQQYTSWGLMQIMGFSARELGFDGYLTQLCDPILGLAYGCLKLKRLFVRYGVEEDVIAAYNQGDNRKTPGGMFQNQTYVDAVCATLRELRALRK